MKSINRLRPIAGWLVAVVVIILASSAFAQHEHQKGDSHDLGSVSFPVSCRPAAQKQFNRAVAWLHSFEYEEAERAFSQVAVTDPKCALAYWGIAASNYHPIWAPPTPDEMRRGAEAVAKARSIGAPTQRERDYINAIAAFYDDHANTAHKVRAAAYNAAMDRLHTAYPDDTEAAALFALTLIAKGMAEADKTYVNEKKAAAILNGILKTRPQHPGVSHYLIHGYDFPALASLAVPAARRYAAIAPASSHAQHMPSHIFTRLGMWNESIASNLDAHRSAKAYAARNRLPGAWDEGLHAMDYLAYAYLQLGRDKEARAVVDELASIRRVDPPNFKVAYSATAVPARYLLERRNWSEAARLTLPAIEGLSWDSFPWAQAHVHYARAIGSARSGGVADARADVEKLGKLREALAVSKGGYDWAKQVEIAHRSATAWLTLAEGKNNEAVAQMRSAADLDDATDKHPVTPGSLWPVREQLGELLLDLKRPAEALVEFRAALQNTPKRFNALLGAARAANAAGDRAAAKRYYAQIAALSAAGDTDRPEILEARRFMSKT